MLILLILNDFIALEHLDFKRTPRNISEYMYIFDSQYSEAEHLDFKRTPRNISEYMYIFDSQYFLSLLLQGAPYV